MTRQEQKQEKIKKEQEFLKSIEGKYLNQQEKSKFRGTTKWKEFRKKFNGRVDPVTLKKLPKRYNLHHMCLCPLEYQNLRMDWFEALSPSSHDNLHWLYGYYRKDRQILKRIQKLLDKMIEINDSKDICDYRKEMKNSKTK